MAITDSLLVSGFGFSIVFVVLIALSFLVKLQSFIISKLFKDGQDLTTAGINQKTQTETAHAAVIENSLPMSAGELKLINVDERTAAMIMAIVSDESKIPLNELRFKSIKALD